MPANNDSACVQTHYALGNIRKLAFAATFDSGDGSFADATVTAKIEGRLLDLATNPGGTAPDDNYDVSIEDQHGHDVLETVGANRHTTNTQKVPVVYSGTSLHPTVDESDTLTLKISGNSTNSATTVIELYYALGG
jgi:hypothetical protein